ncbi:hypothetical protein LTR33_011406 [Friedmanniomyces endolithicus]|nr:hypothetical protein LTR33_011406 [Friedmanniomyces endolithicus]
MVRNIKHSRSEAFTLPSRSTAPPPASYYYGPSKESTRSPAICTPSVLDDQLNSRATPSWAPQDDHSLRYLRKDIVRDAENAVRRSGMDPSALENYHLLKQAIDDATTLSMFMRNPITRSNRSPGAHDGNYDLGLPYRSPVDRLDGTSRQSTSGHAEAVRALRALKHEDQDLRLRDEWTAEVMALPPMPHEYSYRSRYPRLRTDLTALSLNPPSIWSSKLPPMKESSPEVLHMHIQIPDSAPSEPEIKLVCNDLQSGQKVPIYITRTLLKVASPLMNEMYRSEDNGYEESCIIRVAQDFEAVQSLLAFASRGVCDTPFSRHPLDHYRELKTLAILWENRGVEKKALLEFNSAAAVLPSSELHRLADMLVDVHNEPLDNFSLSRMRCAIREAATLRGADILTDGQSLLRLAADGGGPLVEFGEHMGKFWLSGKDAVDDTDKSVAGMWTPGTTPGASSPASRSMRTHSSGKDHWASVGSKCYCEECMSKRRISRR